MDEERAVAQNVTLYPSQVAKVERIMNALKIRKFSQAIQRLVDDAPEPCAEKPDTGERVAIAGNIGAA